MSTVYTHLLSTYYVTLSVNMEERQHCTQTRQASLGAQMPIE